MFCMLIQSEFDDTAPPSFLSVSLMTPTGSPSQTVGDPDPEYGGGQEDNNTLENVGEQVSC